MHLGRQFFRKMVFLQVLVTTLLTVLLIAPVPVVFTLSGSGEPCPDGRDEMELRKAVASSACDYTPSDFERFRNDTRWRHGVTETSGKSPNVYMYGPV